MKNLLKVSIIAILIANVLLTLSCSAKDLECSTVLDKGIINGKYIIKTELSHFPVQKMTYDSYSIGDTFCE